MRLSEFAELHDLNYQKGDNGLVFLPFRDDEILMPLEHLDDYSLIDVGNAVAWLVAKEDIPGLMNITLTQTYPPDVRRSSYWTLVDNEKAREIAMRAARLDFGLERGYADLEVFRDGTSLDFEHVIL